MTEQRIIELEIKAAYQEDLLQDLNKTMAHQQQQIVLLEKTCQYLNDRINSLRFEKSVDTVDEPPPHY